MKALIVVAHPDDETIWAGGTILRHPDWDWTVFSLSRSDDPDRAPRFRAAVSELGAMGLMSDLDDSPVLTELSPGLREIKSRILNMLPERDYDFVLTHGEHGEYTLHERHEQVHRAVRDLVARGSLAGRLVFFAYNDGMRSHPPRPADDADLLIELTEEQFDLKRRVVSRIYGFDEGSFEYSACGRFEGFKAFLRVQDLQLLQCESKRGEKYCVS